MQDDSQKKSFAEREKEILKFWQEHDIFRKSQAKKSPKGEFVFYDGPPFATGLPHYGNLLAGTIKDVIPRFKTMQGYRVPRRWGWDCHGLPVETELEKELGFKSKKDIEQFGIAKFNERARELVMRYANDWRRIIPRLGRFVDMENDYRTMDSSYTETVWWIFKTLHEKGLIYEGWKSMHLCPRCETTLSNFEVSQGYRNVNDISVYVKFQIPNSKFQFETSGDVFAVAWTTTPWTLPGNAALAVNPNRDYAFVEITASNTRDFSVGDAYLVGADEAILRRVFGSESFEFNAEAKVGSFRWKGEAVSFSAKKGVAGRELVGQSYTPLFLYYAADQNLAHRERGWRIYGGEFVTGEDGTGIVHIAPAFGEDDYRLAEKERIPFIQHVATDGTFRKEVADFKGFSAKPKGNPREADEKIAAFLAPRGLLLKTEEVVHPYPHCWRCETPLLNYAAASWFVKVTALRETLVAENKKIRWIPSEVGEYRFGNWLAEARDWAISRSRFWGAPIPVWRCTRCGAAKVVGSLEALRMGSKEQLTKLIFVRHGESKKNTEHRYDDSPDGYPLTHRGRNEAKAVAKRLFEQGGVDSIYTSPVRRARETAEIIAAYLGKKVIVLEHLREVDSGEWDGKREDDPSILAERQARSSLSAEEYYRSKRGRTGESWEDVEKRMAEAIQDLLAKHKGESVLLISHEGPIVYAMKSVDMFTFEETDRFYKKDLIGGYAHPNAVYVHADTGKAFDLHRPAIDEVLLRCDACAKTTGAGENLMRRVSEVFDCWFESGAMPYGEAHYPFEGKEEFDPVGGFLRKPRGFPADFIAEGLDQTRGWFYSMLVLAVGLFGKTPYQSVVVNGIILAEDGAKMSKRLKNYPDPLEVVAKYGADSLRYYLLSSPSVRGEEMRFSERGVDEVMKKVFNRLDNVLSFYLLYASSLEAKSYKLKAVHVLDKWIVARLNQLIAEVTQALGKYELDRAVRPIADFIDDLSTWYLRRSRERIKSSVAEEREEALGTLRFVLCELSKVMAPFTPFFVEYLYKSVGGKKESVHLEDWIEAKNADEDVLDNMREVRRIVSLALERRAQESIKIRQPLQVLKLNFTLPFPSDDKGGLIQLIKEEVNVKEIFENQDIPYEVLLDTKITPELKDEGVYRELLRTVQEMRKKQGFKPGAFAVLRVGATGVSRRFMEQRQQELARVAFLKDVVIADVLAGAAPFQANEISLSLALESGS